MATKDLTKLDEKELVDLQIELSNQRADATAAIKDQQLAVQDELDRRELDKRIGTLTPAQANYLREKLASEAKEEKSDG